jgi:uncharacterized membrane protein YgcG
MTLQNIFVLPIFAAAVLFGNNFVTANPLDVPLYQQPVMDTASMLGSEYSKSLNVALLQVRQAGGPQIGILTVPTLNGETVESYSIRVANQWKLGDAKKDDGMIIVIVKSERILRIEVGQGLEGDVTDLAAKRIIEQEIIPLFKKKDPERGLIAGISSILSLLHFDLNLVPFFKEEKINFQIPTSNGWITDLARVLDQETLAVLEQKLVDFSNSEIGMIHVFLWRQTQLFPNKGSSGVPTLYDLAPEVYSEYITSLSYHSLDMSIIVDIDTSEVHLEMSDDLFTLDQAAKHPLDDAKKLLEQGQYEQGISSAVNIVTDLHQNMSLARSLWWRLTGNEEFRDFFSHSLPKFFGSKIWSIGLFFLVFTLIIGFFVLGVIGRIYVRICKKKWH